MKRILFFAALAAVAQPPGPPPPMQQGDGVWSRDAYFGEAQTFDSCTGHQPGNGQYHHHASPTCLRAQLNDNLELARDTRNGPVYREKASGWTHSPILGWAFDGFPVYGPYGYSDAANAGSAVRRMRSGFRLRAITARMTLAEWSRAYLPNVGAELTAAQQGPPINATFPLGRYSEDYEFVAGLGDLDVYNGRFTVTPEYPRGTYAYFVTIDADGKPAFPYILGRQYYGTLNGGNAQNVPAAAEDVRLAGWRTGSQTARVKSAFNPSASPSATWPFENIAGARTSGGVTEATPADVQRLRQTETDIYVNSNNLASYVMGPWYDALMGGGVFSNWPSRQNFQARITKSPVQATGARTATGLGAVGIFVNGVAMFNMLDGATYSTTTRADAGGGLVMPTAVHVSAASFEKGPFAKGALATAFAMFGATLGGVASTAQSAIWPTDLNGTTVLIRDASGVSHNAPIYFVSPTQVNYRVPEAVAPGCAVVTVSYNEASYPGNIHVRDTYPSVFTLNADGLAAGYFSRLRNGAATNEPIDQPVDVNDTVYVVLYGTGLGGLKDVTATIGGVNADVAYAGAQGTYTGLDQFNLIIPRTLAGRGRVEVVLTVAGKVSNSVFFRVL